MKLTVIGYWGAYPEAEAATSSYLLEKDGFSCLIDCGSGALSRLQLYKNVMDLDAVILSHYHNDHVADVGVLQYLLLVQNTLHQTERILPIYGHRDDEQQFQSLSHQFTKGISYDPSNPLELGPFQFSFLKTIHPVPCYGMRITDGDQTIVYTADTSYQEEWIPFSQDTDLLITDCNFYESQDGTKAGHMNSREGATIAAKANVQQLLLSHLPHFGEHKQLINEAKAFYSGSVQLAYEGFVWST
ncbi:MBL fold metallo-hydrolase [Aquibacillus sp. 3ASR75-11]|uniref:MBL fold metallo-hydrolase n=1 Tax=Terrihalobacillus insolitus TaxID=2950438 RepID=A0A9X3WWQ9_9BACI|nr:MBL fold metallo-hydrolase [Terrihalobacillus insolitus]MDC3425601.1 MBL fold metallo-hydrolase [Terrihalobacillus insolitus]